MKAFTFFTLLLVVAGTVSVSAKFEEPDEYETVSTPLYFDELVDDMVGLHKESNVHYTLTTSVLRLGFED
jgi:hypothetical protein